MSSPERLAVCAVVLQRGSQAPPQTSQKTYFRPSPMKREYYLVHTTRIHTTAVGGTADILTWSMYSVTSSVRVPQCDLDIATLLNGRCYEAENLHSLEMCLGTALFLLFKV